VHGSTPGHSPSKSSHAGPPARVFDRGGTSWLRAGEARTTFTRSASQGSGSVEFADLMKEFAAFSRGTYWRAAANGCSRRSASRSWPSNPGRKELYRGPSRVLVIRSGANPNGLGCGSKTDQRNPALGWTRTLIDNGRRTGVRLAGRRQLGFWVGRSTNGGQRTAFGDILPRLWLTSRAAPNRNKVSDYLRGSRRCRRLESVSAR
jgi:hypothetical protein